MPGAGRVLEILLRMALAWTLTSAIRSPAMQGRQAARFYSKKSRPVQNCPKNVQQTAAA